MPERTYEFGAFLLSPAEHRLLRNGEPVALTPRVFDLLRVLVENAGHLLDKDRLLTEVWHDAVVEEANLTRAISVLRKALGENGTERYIETVPKKGYRFLGSVRVRTEEVDGHVEGAVARAPRRILVAALAAAVIIGVGSLTYVLLVRRVPAHPAGAPSASIHRQLTFTGKELTPSLSPDGRRVAYVSDDPPHRKVMVRDVAGGSPVEVFRAPEAGGLRWSPDGSELMFSARGDGADGLHIARPTATPARRIGGGGWQVACWSPDSSTIAVAAFVGRKILLVDRAGAVQRSIALQGVQEWIWDLDWSPLNGRILFVVDDDRGRPAVWSIRPDGTEQVKLFTGTTEILAARWAPGEGFYYFTRVNQTMSLYKVAVDVARGTARGDAVALLTGLETDEGFGLSADARRLVYTRAPYYSNLWVVEPDRRGALRQRQLTHATSVIERPRVSPDGRSILFSMGYESHANLYTIPADGGPPRQLTYLNAFSAGGVWSPDGGSVAFGSNEGGQKRIWLVNADGSSPRPIHGGELSESYELAWAPGAHLLYQQHGNRNYYVTRRERAEHELLIGDPSVGWVAYPVYSPDGSKLAFGWNRRSGDGRYAAGLYVIETATRRESLVYRLPKDSAALPIGWSPDGSAIYAYDGKRAAYRGILVPFELTMTSARILRIPLSGGRVEKVATLPFREVGTVAVFPDGRRFVCSAYTSRSDVWLVEDFDPSAAAPIATRVSRRSGP